MTELTIMDEVIVNTDTLFDEDGIAVSIRNGAHARLWKLEENWAQIIVWWDQEGVGIPEILGVDVKYLDFYSHVKL